MKMKTQNVLRLIDMLVTNNLGDNQFPEFELALENVIDGNIGTSAMYHIDNLLYDAIAMLPKLEKEQSLFRFFRFKEPEKPLKWNGESCFIMKDILNNDITLSDPTAFNDPMDPLLCSWVNMRKRKNNQNKEDLIYQLIDFALKKIRICCLDDPLRDRRAHKTKITYCDPIMWAHYAEGHRGICVKYKIKPSNIYENDDIVVRLQKVEYISNMPLDGNISFTDSLCAKGKNWSYENEMRLIMFSRKEFNSYHQLHNYEIESVYMGCRLDSEKKEYLKGLCKEKNIKLFQMDFSENDISKLQENQIF